MLLTGEAGIGKTALVAEVADDARRQGALVVSGTCWDGDGAPGYWPWIQVVRALQRGVPSAEWTDMGTVAGEVLGYLLGEREVLRQSSSKDNRGFEVYDVVTTLLTAAAATRPVVVALDDLQWADPASLRLLDFLVRHTAALHRILVLATYRDVEVEVEGYPHQPLFSAMVAKATLIPLTGLPRDSVRALITRATGHEPEPGLAEEVSRRTGGNPFFIEQMVELWGAGGARAAIPPGVSNALQRRLGRLPATTSAALTTAAVVGAEFDPRLLAACLGISVEATRDLLASAVAARLVERRALTFAFVHDLVREALAAALGAEQAQRIHASVLNAAAQDPGLAGQVAPSQLAHHAFEAVPDVAPDVALGYVLAAARDASSRLASEEASGHYWRALDLIPVGDEPARVAVTLELGAEQRRGGDLAGARRTFDGLLHAARRRNDPEALARAVLGLHSLGDDLHGDKDGVTLADEAYEALAGGPLQDSPLAALLLAASSRARAHSMDEDRNRAAHLSARAVAIARACDNDEALGFSLLAHHDAIWDAGTAPQRAVLANQMTAIARRSSDPELELQASLLRVVALLEMGDPGGLDEHAAFVAMVDRTRLPRFRYLALSRQGAMATLSGHFDAARALVDEAVALADRIGEVDGPSVWGDQVWELARLQGRHEEVDALAAILRERGDPHATMLEAAVALDRGDPSLALRHLIEMEALVERWPRWAWLMWLATRAELAAASGDQELCATARDAIAPFRSLWAVLAGAVVVHGPMAYWAALVDVAESRWTDAIAGFTVALEAAERLRSRPWVVLAQLQLAIARIGLSAGGDARDAEQLLGEVEREAIKLGMIPAAARARDLRATMQLDDGASPASDNMFHFDGALWRLQFAGRTELLPDAKGLHDLHALLARPRVDVPAVELLTPGGPALTLGSDIVMDERAKQEYRRHLTQLDADIDSAIARSDTARAVELESERQALLDELRRATGLGGRTRRLGDHSERARKTVTARIRDIMRRLDKRHPELARHLRTTVSTGTACRYQPPADMNWKL